MLTSIHCNCIQIFSKTDNKVIAKIQNIRFCSHGKQQVINQRTFVQKTSDEVYRYQYHFFVVISDDWWYSKGSDFIFVEGPTLSEGILGFWFVFDWSLRYLPSPTTHYPYRGLDDLSNWNRCIPAVARIRSHSLLQLIYVSKPWVITEKHKNDRTSYRGLDVSKGSVFRTLCNQ